MRIRKRMNKLASEKCFKKNVYDKDGNITPQSVSDFMYWEEREEIYSYDGEVEKDEYIGYVFVSKYETSNSYIKFSINLEQFLETPGVKNEEEVQKLLKAIEGIGENGELVKYFFHNIQLETGEGESPEYRVEQYDVEFDGEKFTIEADVDAVRFY